MNDTIGSVARSVVGAGAGSVLGGGAGRNASYFGGGGEDCGQENVPLHLLSNFSYISAEKLAAARPFCLLIGKLTREGQDGPALRARRAELTLADLPRFLLTMAHVSQNARERERERVVFLVELTGPD